jgi:uncharacterized membrane protein
MCHILATLVDLARRGIITIEEVGTGEKDYVIRFMGGASVAKENREIEERLEHKASVKVKAYELKLLNALFEGKPVRRLSALKDKFYTHIPEIEESLWKALVKARWVEHPSRVERALLSGLLIGMKGLLFMVSIIEFFTIASIIAIVVTHVVENVVLAFLSVYALWVVWSFAARAWLLPWLGLDSIVSKVSRKNSRGWPYRTRAGAERAARWQAFARWLKALHEINPTESKAQLEAYLPYAIAFGIEKEFLARWLAIAPDTPPPSWYRSTSSYGSMRSSSSTSDRFSWGSMGNTGGEGRGGGSYSLDSLADSLTGSLNSFASSLSGMLNATASTLSSAPPSRSGSGGGGWSGGGSRGGGGGGGGRSSFS